MSWTADPKVNIEKEWKCLELAKKDWFEGKESMYISVFERNNIDIKN